MQLALVIHGPLLDTNNSLFFCVCVFGVFKQGTAVQHQQRQR